MDIAALQEQLRQFADERDWAQFHTPKNFVMALTGEVGELTEIFQWLTPEQSADVAEDPRLRVRAGEEMADVLAYLLMLADALDVDLAAALSRKMQANEEKYPVHLARGSAAKYDELGGTSPPAGL
jgi:dCTP diphosphatase